MSVLGLLGTVHTDEMRKEFNYSLELMRDSINKFRPDIICGEIRPEDWQKYYNNKNYSGYLGPSEYRSLIISLCEEKDIEFIPVDWFTEDLEKMDYFSGKSDIEREKIMNEYGIIMNDYINIGRKSTIPFNSFEFNNIVENKQNFQQSINPEVHNIYWIRRNQIMVERIQRVLDENKGKNILCTVGAEHVYFYYDNLNKLGWEIKFPLG